jgi:hypothetical protein
MVLRLMPRSPSADSTSATGAKDHTVWPYASAPFVCRGRRSLTGQKPALPSASRNRRCRVHRIPSPPSVTIAIRPSWWAGTRRFYRVEKCGTVTSSRIKKADFSMSKATGAKGRFDQLAAGKGHSGQRIASMPLRRITSSKTSAGPVGRLTPRSSCETYPTVRLR